MKVLSIRQPWASLIIYGYKRYEFRSWKTKYRGQLLIHASKGVEKEYLNIFKHLNIPLPTGCIIGEVEISNCIEVTKNFENSLIKENKLVYGQTIGRGGFAWQVNNPIVYKEIIPVNGSLGLWEYQKDSNN